MFLEDPDRLNESLSGESKNAMWVVLDRVSTRDQGLYLELYEMGGRYRSPAGTGPEGALRHAAHRGLDQIVAHYLRLGVRTELGGTLIDQMHDHRNGNWEKTVAICREYGLGPTDRNLEANAAALESMARESVSRQERIIQLKDGIRAMEAQGLGDGPDARQWRQELERLEASE